MQDEHQTQSLQMKKREKQYNKDQRNHNLTNKVIFKEENVLE